MKDQFTIEDLKGFAPARKFFAGVDSDGCVFDTMEVKQKRHFHPLIIKWWRLEALEPELRAAAEFVNLYSKWRGQNRFTNLLITFDLMAQWPACVAKAAACHTALPDTTALRAYCGSGLPLGNPTLTREVERTGDAELKRLLGWSLAVNDEIDRNMDPVHPFPWAVKSLEKLQSVADCLVVSQTPEAALVKEWRQHGVDHLVAIIAGQELGTKAEHLTLAAGGKYPAGHILMIGDAPGDLKAAETAGALFFPVIPRDEDAAWKFFHDEALPRFLEGRYAGDYEARLKTKFLDALPDLAPWQQEAGHG